VRRAGRLHRRDLRARANLAPVMFEGGGLLIEPVTTPGGQLTITTDVENFPGFPRGIMGPKLMELRAPRLSASEPAFAHRRDRGGLGHATLPHHRRRGQPAGRHIDYRHRRLGQVAGDSLGRQVSQLRRFRCATCDGALFKGREVLVVGGGDTAMEEATYLTHHASRSPSSTAGRSSAPRASCWIARATTPRSARHQRGHRRDSGATTQAGRDGRAPARHAHRCDARVGLRRRVHGHRAPTQQRVVQGAFDMDEVGYLLTKPGSTATSVAGVFACGDVADHVYRQAITAAGTGCMAAIDAERFLAHG